MNRLIIAMVSALASFSSFAADDPAECKRIVYAFLDGNQFMRQIGAVERVKEWKTSGLSDCDIQEKLLRTRAQKPEPTQNAKQSTEVGPRTNKL